MMDEVQSTKDDVVETLELQLVAAQTEEDISIIERKLAIIRRTRK